jgi:hypothetical protein
VTRDVTFDGLVGQEVEQMWFWADTCRIVFDDGDEPEPRTYVDIARDVDRDASLLRLIGRRVTAATSLAGSLHLTFDEGMKLSDAPDERYESWRVVVDHQVTQCLPGGELGRW